MVLANRGSISYPQQVATVIVTYMLYELLQQWFSDTASLEETQPEKGCLPENRVSTPYWNSFL